MNPRQQLEELVTWTKQAGHWLNENHPRLAQATEPLMARTSLDLGYWMSAHEFIQATQAPPLVQTAMYAASLAGKNKFNEIVVSEINRALVEYNSQQRSSNSFNRAKTLALTGIAGLTISTASGYLEADSQSNPFSNQQKIEYVQQDLTIEPVKVLEEEILEPIQEPAYSNHTKIDLDFTKTELDLSHLVQDNIPQINLEDFEELKLELEETFERQSLLEIELHPKAQVHYNRFKGLDNKRLIRKIERTQQYDDLIKSAAEKYDVPYTAMFALTIKESDGKVRAKSHVGARGLMQIMPRTGKYIAELMGKQFVELTGRKRFKTSDLYDPKINIEMGAFYLRFIHDTYGERIMKKRGKMPNDYKEWTEEDVWDFTMGCYNRGPGGMTRNMIKAGADTFWDLEKNQTTDEVLRYVPKIRAIEKVYVEELQKKAGINDEVARLVH